MSILLATFAIPMLAARNGSAVRGLRQAVVGFAAWVAIYVGLLSVMHWY
ncbi:MAG: hypothetical protein ABI120_10915 [Gemmatimonadaceae bacterium]